MQHKVLEIFPWQESFATGIAKIDEQHQKLVGLLNKLAGHLAYGSDTLVLSEVLSELSKYTEYHFKTEEVIWLEYFGDSPEFIKHQKAHNNFIKNLNEINLEDNDLESVISNLVGFLTHWLAYHILESDMRLAKTVHALGSGNTLAEAKGKASLEMSGIMETMIQTILNMYHSLSTRTLDLMREKHLRKLAEKKLRIKEESWQFILDSSEDEVWDWHIDTEDSEGTPSEITTDHISSIHPIHFDDVDQFIYCVEQHLKCHTEYFSNRHRVLSDNGSWKWIVTKGKVVNRDKSGKAIRMVGTSTDVTEKELAVSVFYHSNEAIFITDKDNDIIATNPAFTSISGYRDVDVIGKHPSILSSGRHDKTFYKEMWNSIEQFGCWKGEIWNKKKSGEIFPEHLSISTINNYHDELEYRIAIFSDITEKKLLDDKVLRQANIDTLTNLYNRNSFNKALEHEINKCKRLEKNLILLFIDLDFFKQINDSLGHSGGDEVLKDVASRIIRNTRKSDICARLGGDEFVVLLTDIKELTQVDKIANNILDELKKPFHILDNDIYLSASIGISVFPDNATDPDLLLNRADQAMYKAKDNGKSCYCYFTQSMQQDSKRRQALLAELYTAITEQQFVLYYQPIININTGIIEKAEALIRWKHPTCGLLFPDDFIGLAEEAGLINSIGNWVILEAENAIKRWGHLGQSGLQISVNVSPMQLSELHKEENSIVNTLTQVKSPSKLILELTETALFKNEKTQQNMLGSFNDMGVKIALDDFGTGYSSLSHILDLNINYLKIDRSFISQMMESDKAKIICEATIAMAKKLEIKVVAEGVETQQQLNLLKEMDCDYGQGYLISKAVPMEEFDILLTKKFN
ncbi:MAG: bacteriohemerythrin [Colwellia sp.]|nr:bacteriohemerythrin [Colwellia sp.]